MKIWQRTTYVVVLCFAILSLTLMVKWRNEVEANLCPPGYCCITSEFVTESTSGSVTVFTNTTCGYFSWTFYPDGTEIIFVCPDNGQCGVL